MPQLMRGFRELNQFCFHFLKNGSSEIFHPAEKDGKLPHLWVGPNLGEPSLYISSVQIRDHAFRNRLSADNDGGSGKRIPEFICNQS